MAVEFHPLAGPLPAATRDAAKPPTQEGPLHSRHPPGGRPGKRATMALPWCARHRVAVTVAVNAPVFSPHRPRGWVLGHRGSGRTTLRGAVMAHDAVKQEPDVTR